MTLVRCTYPTARSFAPFARSPWAGLESEIDHLLQSSLDETAPRRIPVELYDDKDNNYVRAELPGVNRDDISIELVNGSLTAL